ncbi:MAG: membrane dipeptidase [Clostridia bacterium]|nr:membrane dipeptidase [Clostridia bacterium]
MMKYFDLHCDTAYECYIRKVDISDLSLAVSSGYSSCFEEWKQVFAVWIKDDLKGPFEVYKKIIADIKAKLKTAPKNLKPYFAIEGGAVIENDISRLSRLKSDGIRFITLTWNGENRIAGGSKTNAGLTKFGKKVIANMNRLGIACDLSHLNDKSFWKAAEFGDKILATHSNCRAVYDCPRNLDDEQIKIIAEKGGVIGLTFFPAFLGGDTFQKIYENIYHLLDMGFEKNICIGSDFDGADMDSRLNCAADIPELFVRLSEKGLSDRTLKRIFYENADEYVKSL